MNCGIGGDERFLVHQVDGLDLQFGFCRGARRHRQLAVQLAAVRLQPRLALCLGRLGPGVSRIESFSLEVPSGHPLRLRLAIGLIILCMRRKRIES
jgi:hypothetical protein